MLVFRSVQEIRGNIELKSRRQAAPVGRSIPDGSRSTLPGAGTKKLRALLPWQDYQHEQQWRAVYHRSVFESRPVSGNLHQLAGTTGQQGGVEIDGART